MAQVSKTETKPSEVKQRPVEIIDQTGMVVGQPTDIVGVVETILPYFPQDPEMRRYLALISSGFTRKEALKRVKKTTEDLDEWRKDENFFNLDAAGYDSLRKDVAINYHELMVRRVAMQLLEMDEVIIGGILDKIENGINLTADEKLIYSKRANSYGPEQLEKLSKLAHPEEHTKDFNENPNSPEIVDWVLMVKGKGNIPHA